jgi:hypothetical protein
MRQFSSSSSSSSSRAWFEAGVLLCFLLAFASLLSEGQFLALYGKNGLLPLTKQLRFVYEDGGLMSASLSSSSMSWREKTSKTIELMRKTRFNIAWLASAFRFRSYEKFMECVLYLGVLLSFYWLVSSSSLVGRGGGDGARGRRRRRGKWYQFALLAWMYQSMMDVGDAFLSFQWDALLIECGFGCAVGAWLFPDAAKEKEEADEEEGKDDDDDDARYAWIPRAILFKLMLMSGCVKIQSKCKTWLNLSALDYHFATQPLPNGFSRAIANGVSSKYKRIGVALTYVAEGPLAFLIVAPTKMARRAACLGQILFQVGIILSGNYAYFNLLTIVLALASFAGGERKAVYKKTVVEKEEKETDDTDGEAARTLENNKAKALPVLQHSMAMIATHLSFIFFTICAVNMFEPSKDGVKLRGSSKNVNKRLTKFLDIAVPVSRTYLILVAVPLTYAYRSILAKITKNKKALNGNKDKAMKKIASFTLQRCRDVLLMAYLLIVTAPMGEIAPNKKVEKAHPSLRANAQFLDTTTSAIQRHVPTYVRRITSGYGLFRSMTGVGDDGKVARREIIFEIAPDAEKVEDIEWTELEFKHKPGDMRKRPSFVAPHQPRLDWQMWFAALRGDGVFQDPRYRWFSMFIIRILQKSPEVWKILDPSMLKHMETTTYLRISMYEYDFAPRKDDDDDGYVYVRKNLGVLLPPVHLESPELEKLRNAAGPIDYEKERNAPLEIPDVDAVTFIVSAMAVIFASLIYNTKRKRRRRKLKVS